MVAVPAFTPFTLPVLLTVATDVSELFQVTFLSVRSDGVSVAVSVSVLPFSIVAFFLSRLILGATISMISSKFFQPVASA